MDTDIFPCENIKMTKAAFKFMRSGEELETFRKRKIHFSAIFAAYIYMIQIPFYTYVYTDIHYIMKHFVLKSLLKGFLRVLINICST